VIDKRAWFTPVWIETGRCRRAQGRRTNWRVREAAFEDDPGVPAPHVFACGQRRRFHSVIAAWSRSRAERIGR